MLEVQFEVLVKKTFLFQRPNAECQATINKMLQKIFDINQSINEHTTNIKIIEVRTTDYKRQKREYEFYNRCFQDGKYDEIMKELNNECSICFEQMLTPIKIFQCSQGHLLCEPVSRMLVCLQKHVRLAKGS